MADTVFWRRIGMAESPGPLVKVTTDTSGLEYVLGLLGQTQAKHADSIAKLQKEVSSNSQAIKEAADSVSILSEFRERAEGVLERLEIANEHRAAADKELRERVAKLEALQQAGSGGSNASSGDIKAVANTCIWNDSVSDLRSRIAEGKAAVASSQELVDVWTDSALGDTDGGAAALGAHDLKRLLAEWEKLENRVQPAMRHLEVAQRDLKLRMKQLADRQRILSEHSPSGSGSGSGSGSASTSASRSDVASEHPVDAATVAALDSEVQQVVSDASSCLDAANSTRSKLLGLLGAWGTARASDTIAQANQSAPTSSSTIAVAPSPAPGSASSVSVTMAAEPHPDGCASRRHVAALDGRLSALEARQSDFDALKERLDILKAEIKQVSGEVSDVVANVDSKAPFTRTDDLQSQIDALMKQIEDLRAALGIVEAKAFAPPPSPLATLPPDDGSDPKLADTVSTLRSRLTHQGQQIQALFDSLKQRVASDTTASEDQKASRALDGFKRELDSTARQLADLIRQQAAVQASLREKASVAEVQSVAKQVSDKADQTWVTSVVHDKVRRPDVEQMLNDYMKAVDRQISGTKEDVMGRTTSSLDELKARFRRQLREAIEKALVVQSTSLTTSFGRKAAVSCIACDRPINDMYRDGVPIPLHTQLPPPRPVTADLDHYRGGGFRVPSRTSRPGTPEVDTTRTGQASMSRKTATPGHGYPLGYHWEFVADESPQHVGLHPTGGAAVHAPTFASAPHTARSARSPSHGEETMRGPGPASTTPGPSGRPRRAASAGVSRQRRPGSGGPATSRPGSGRSTSSRRVNSGHEPSPLASDRPVAPWSSGPSNPHAHSYSHSHSQHPVHPSS